MGSSNFVIEPLRSEHIDELANGTRKQDLCEFISIFRSGAKEAIQACVSNSASAWAASVNGELLCAFGVVDLSMIERIGTPWLVAHRRVDKHRIRFLRESVRALRELGSSYEVMRGWIDPSNALSLRWVKWLGFEHREEEPYGAEQHPFIRVEWSK